MSDENKSEVKKNKKSQKTKNLVSLVILLSGLFVGSLFVDLSQLIKGGGISQKVLDNKDVFQLDGKTWVAYSEPIVKMSIINDDDCEDCKVDEALVWFKKIVPTILSNKVVYDSDEGKNLIKKFGIKSLPAFVFDKEVKDTEFYGQAQQLFNEKDGKYILDTGKLGLPAGKYIETPKITDNDIKIGSDDAKVKIVEFSDFQCPYCKMFQSTVDDIVKEYGDDVQLVFKNLPLDSIHPRAGAAALAGECANEQGKFIDYSAKLFDNQKDWTKAEDNKLFVRYAVQLKMDSNKFNQCLKDNKYKDAISATVAQAEEFGISGTPALFINDKFKGGVTQAGDLKAIIDEYLGKQSEEASNNSNQADTGDSAKTTEETNK